MAGVRLKGFLTAVEKDGLTVYGGRQQWSSSRTINMCGCGVVAAVELFLYLYRSRRNFVCPLFDCFPTTEHLSSDEYDFLLKKICRAYLPLIPHFGINGISLAIGVNRFFVRYSVPYKARWGVGPHQLWSSIREMLEDDIPVVFAVGPNFPMFWRTQRTAFYALQKDGRYTPVSSACAHYVIVTGIDDRWLEISSWGNRYFINKAEFIDYVRQSSNYVVSNILYVSRKH